MTKKKFYQTNKGFSRRTISLWNPPKIKKETKPRPFKAKTAKFDVDLITPRLGWLPEATVKQKLLHTTQLIPRMSMSVPMGRHFAPVVLQH
jgi:hypothetical protein